MIESLVFVTLLSVGQSACGAPTPRDSEGPFYKSGAPARASLVEPGAKADKLILSGRVLTRDCKPIAAAVLDFWHTDERGEYDHAGFRYRGKVTTDSEGRYRLETNLPANYPGRPRHVHVKVFAPGARTLTTQVYFPSEVRGPLTAKVEPKDGVLHGAFDFVIDR